VANLFLVRAEGRQRDVAVRTVLGAGTFQILRYRLAESLILSSLAGALSLGLAYAAVQVVTAYGTHIPRIDEVKINSAVLLLTAIIACCVGFAFSVLPHIRVSAHNWAASLKDGARGVTAGSRRLRTRDALVVIQMALALVLLVGSGLVVRSFLNLRRVDPGFNPRGVLTLRLALPAARYPTQIDAVAAQQRILDGISKLPGVEAVGIVDCLPLLGCTNANTMEAEDFPLKPNELPPKMAMNTAGPGYFRAMGIPLVKGRGFERRDHEERTGAMVISQAVATRFWPTEDPIGKRIFPGLRGNAPWYTIVGVVGSIRQDELSEPPAEIMYLPMVNIDDRNYSETRNIAVVVRTAADPVTMAEPARRVIASVDPELPVANVQTMEEIMARSLMGRELTMLLLSVAAVVALFLGAIGLYGTVSYLVGQRAGEIGMRMALGARAADVLRMILYQGGVLACLGLTIGLLSAWALTRVLQSLLFDVSPTDSLTYAAVSCLLLGVALIASYLPARRASRIDPMEALRSE
jgi:putative ABC transport system permease protein